MTAQPFQKRPVVVLAIQWTGSNADDMAAFCGSAWETDPTQPVNGEHAAVRTYVHSAWQSIYPGNWVVKDAHGFCLYDSQAFEREFFHLDVVFAPPLVGNVAAPEGGSPDLETAP